MANIYEMSNRTEMLKIDGTERFKVERKAKVNKYMQNDFLEKPGW